MKRSAYAVFVGIAIMTGVSCTRSSTAREAPAGDPKTFLDSVDETLKRLSIAQNQGGWVAQTYITEDTEAVDARETQRLIEADAQFAEKSTRFDKVEVRAA